MPPGFDGKAGLLVLSPLVTDRGKLVPVGFPDDREPVPPVVLLEEGDAGAQQAKRIGRPFLPSVLQELRGLRCRPVVAAALGDHALAIDADDDHHFALVGPILGEDERHDLPAEGIQAVARSNLDEEVELLARAIRGNGAPDQIKLVRAKLDGRPGPWSARIADGAPSGRTRSACAGA